MVFRCRCTGCQTDLALGPERIAVTVCGAPGAGTWAFTCFACGIRHVERLTPATLEKFIRSGIRVRALPPPGPPLIAGGTPEGPPINEDEVIAFGLQLEGGP